MLRRVRQVNQQEGECFAAACAAAEWQFITADAVNSVLRFFDEEVESSVLSEVIVPISHAGSRATFPHDTAAVPIIEREGRKESPRRW